MKKIVSLLLVLCMIMGLTAVAAAEGIPADQIKVGFIFIGDENEGYTYSHYKAAMDMKEALGLSDEQVLIKYNIPEDDSAEEAAYDLADSGCNIIFANSFGHESYLWNVAAEYPEVQFCHATGGNAAKSGLENAHNYFTAIHEARYVSGVVGGMKLQQLIDEGVITADQAKVGYVGAHPFAEVISGYTAFFLGVRSQCPSATMEVIYTGSWSDASLEKSAAESLIADGCYLIGQHADTTGASQACEPMQRHIVGYNISMIPTAQNYALTSATNNWASYVTYAVQCVINGEKIVTDWSRGYADGAVAITDLNPIAIAPGTAEKVEEVIAGLKDGTIKVFDVSTFTCQPAADGSYQIDENGHLTSAFSQDTDGDWVYDTAEIIVDGAYAEGSLISAPAFNIIIDGITVK
jgi:basic membrane protein A